MIKEWPEALHRVFARRLCIASGMILHVFEVAFAFPSSATKYIRPRMRDRSEGINQKIINACCEKYMLLGVLD